MRSTVPHPCGKQGDEAVPQQLAIAYEAGLLDQHRSLKECVAACVYRQRGGITAVAGKLDMSPSHLSEVLAGGGERHRKFDLDEFERYVATYGDTTPILYLVAKYLGQHGTDQAAAAQQLRAMLDQLPSLLAAAGVQQKRRA
jgi:hypothetical protein